MSPKSKIEKRVKDMSRNTHKKYSAEETIRMVPISSALDIGGIWDGYDIVRSLSRIIDYK